MAPRRKNSPAEDPKIEAAPAGIVPRPSAYRPGPGIDPSRMTTEERHKLAELFADLIMADLEAYPPPRS